jgi:hypothetical protein
MQMYPRLDLDTWFPPQGLDVKHGRPDPSVHEDHAKGGFFEWPPWGRVVHRDDPLLNEQTLTQALKNATAAWCSLLASDFLIMWQRQEEQLQHWTTLMDRCHALAGFVPAGGEGSAGTQSHRGIIQQALAEDRMGPTMDRDPHVLYDPPPERSLVRNECHRHTDILARIQTLWLCRLRDMAIAAIVCYHMPVQRVNAGCRVLCEQRMTHLLREIQQNGQPLKCWTTVCCSVYDQMYAQFQSMQAMFAQERDHLYTQTIPHGQTLTMDGRLILHLLASKTALPTQLMVKKCSEAIQKWIASAKEQVATTDWLDVNQLGEQIHAMKTETCSTLSISALSHRILNWMSTLSAIDFLCGSLSKTT